MDLQQGLKVKRKAGEGGLIMGALVELEKARSCGARECVKEHSRHTILGRTLAASPDQLGRTVQNGSTRRILKLCRSG